MSKTYLLKRYDWSTRDYSYLDVPLEFSKWLGSVGFTLLINGVYLLVITH